MNFWQISLLLCAGFFGGIANSLAGGASLFTFPALMLAGLSPIAANASNSFGLLPSNGLGAYSDREMMPHWDLWFYAGLIVTVIGGLCGAILLFNTSERFFEILVPALIGLATLVFACGKQIQNILLKNIDKQNAPLLRLTLIFITAIYCGYFGAGVGVVFLAVLSATTTWSLRSSNAYKNALGFLGNVGANVIFIWQGLIAWPFTLVLMIGTATGGYVGVHLAKTLSPKLIRLVIIGAGVLMTLVYVQRYWI